MIRYAAVAVVALTLVLISGTDATHATPEAPMALTAVPDGPRLASIKWSFRPERLELLTIDQAGASPLMLAGGGLNKRPLPVDRPSWSPDGSQIAFIGLVENADALSTFRIFVVSADGNGLRELPGTKGAYSPVFSPDGHTIAFARRRIGNGKGVHRSVSTWLADLSGGMPRRITPWRNGLRQTPSSFSPDGSVLAITRAVREKPAEAVALRMDGSGSTVLARKAITPIFSPDGLRIAFLRGPRRTYKVGEGYTTVTLTDLYTMNVDGGDLRRLTQTPRAVELTPSWDPSGQTLAYVESKALESHLRTRDSLLLVNSDGGCRTKILAEPLTELLGIAWRPGPGREAGPISCDQIAVVTRSARRW